MKIEKKILLYFWLLIWAYHTNLVIWIFLMNQYHFFPWKNLWIGCIIFLNQNLMKICSKKTLFTYFQFFFFFLSFFFMFFFFSFSFFFIHSLILHLTHTYSPCNPTIAYKHHPLLPPLLIVTPIIIYSYTIHHLALAISIDIFLKIRMNEFATSFFCLSYNSLVKTKMKKKVKDVEKRW